MPETNNGYNAANQTNRKWVPFGNFVVNAGTLVVLIGTLGTIIWYTPVTSRILDADTRPYVAVTGSDYITFKAGDRLVEPVNLANSGKLPADALIQGVVTFQPSKQAEAGSFPDEMTHLFIWPSPIENPYITVKSVNALSNENFELLKSSAFYVYIAVRVRYGGHTTRICKEYTFDIKSRTPACSSDSCSSQMPEPTLCKDPHSNYAD
jgi:hypothetical protein